MTAKYDRIGKHYDTTRRADPYLVKQFHKYLAIEPGNKYLDIACGSGNYTSALAKYGGEWVGIDQSETMLDQARQKSEVVRWLRGDVESLPFGDGEFDAAMCSLAIHHFKSLEVAFKEIRRVLRSPRFVLFTSTTEQMMGYWLTEYFPVAMRKSWDQMPGELEISGALSSAGFDSISQVPFSVTNELSDFFLYSGKFKPEMYLDPTVRQGISTFSSLADEDEIEVGCDRLASDISSGRVNRIIEQYQNDMGDYSFFVCGK